MPDKTIAEAAAELRLVAEEVKVLLHGDFQTRHRSFRMFLVAMVTMLLSVIGGYFLSVVTISECFLVGAPRPDSCKMIPGYEESQKNNEELLKEFRDLQKRSLRNERRIERLENAR